MWTSSLSDDEGRIWTDRRGRAAAFVCLSDIGFSTRLYVGTTLLLPEGTVKCRSFQGVVAGRSSGLDGIEWTILLMTSRSGVG